MITNKKCCLHNLKLRKHFKVSGRKQNNAMAFSHKYNACSEDTRPWCKLQEFRTIIGTNMISKIARMTKTRSTFTLILRHHIRLCIFFAVDQNWSAFVARESDFSSRSSSLSPLSIIFSMLSFIMFETSSTWNWTLRSFLSWIVRVFPLEVGPLRKKSSSSSSCKSFSFSGSAASVMSSSDRYLLNFGGIPEL